MRCKHGSVSGNEGLMIISTIRAKYDREKPMQGKWGEDKTNLMSTQWTYFDDVSGGDSLWHLLTANNRWR